MIVVPQKLVSNTAVAQVKFEQLLQILLNGNWCLAEACDEILTQLKGFVLEIQQNHLAEFLSLELSMLLRGQATVERGFSVNSELLVKNLQEKILVLSYFVYSSVKSDANHFSELSFASRLKLNAWAARMRYQLYLEE